MGRIHFGWFSPLQVLKVSKVRNRHEVNDNMSRQAVVVV